MCTRRSNWAEHGRSEPAFEPIAHPGRREADEFVDIGGSARPCHDLELDAALIEFGLPQRRGDDMHGPGGTPSRPS